MKTEEIVKELREVIDCIANEELKTATRTALTIIKKLQPKPLFVPGPAKYRNGTDCIVLSIHEEDDHGLLTEYWDGSKWRSMRHKLNGGYTVVDTVRDVMPNNTEPEEK